MAPKRAKAKAVAVTKGQADPIIDAFKDHHSKHDRVDFGRYDGRDGPFVKELVLFHNVLMAVLQQCPSGVLAWQSFKDLFLKLFDDKPRLNPWSKEKGWSLVDSAEEAAKILKNMAMSVRRIALYPKKYKTHLEGIPDDVKESVQKLVDSISHGGPEVEIVPSLPAPVPPSPVSIASGSSEWGGLDIEADAIPTAGSGSGPTPIDGDRDASPADRRPTFAERRGQTGKRQREKVPKTPDSKPFVLPRGWSTEKRKRKSGKSKGVIDTYYLSPDGVEFRSKVKVEEFLQKSKRRRGQSGA